MIRSAGRFFLSRRGMFSAFILALGVLGGCWEGPSHEIYSDKERPKADIAHQLYDLDGKPVQFAPIPGKPMVVNFWATWCGPCVREMPSLNHYAQLRADQNVWVVCIANEEPAKIKRFLQNKKLTHITFLIDGDGKLFTRQKVEALPTSVMVDAEGGYGGRIEGGITWDTPAQMAEIDRALGLPRQEKSR